MADKDDNFDKTKIIAALRAKGVSDKEIEKLYGPLPKVNFTQPNSKKAREHQQKNAWKYKNKHIRDVREEDMDPDYEPIEELRQKTKRKPKTRISKKKPKPKPKKNDWNATAEARLQALYEAGYSTAEIAKEFNTTTDAITGKISRMKAGGWKAQVGTTTNKPLPGGSSPKPGKTNQMSPNTKRAIANMLEVNFGVVGRYFAKKWGLYEKKGTAGSAGGSADVTGAVIKANQMVMNSLTKLDMTLRRGTSSLTKALSLSTARMTDAITNVADLIRKHQTTEMLGGGDKDSGPVPTSGPGRGGALGLIAALFGGAALSALLVNRVEASTNYNDRIDPEEDTPPVVPEPTQPENTEVIPEAEIKVKELTFEADDIIFEADQFKFTNKDGVEGTNPIGGPTGGAGATSGGGGASGGSGVGGSPETSSGSAAGLVPEYDQMGNPTGRQIPNPNAATGDQSARKAKEMSGGPTGAAGASSGGGVPSGTLAEQRSGYGKQLTENPALMDKLMALMSAEEGSDSQARKMLAESAMNRGASRGTASLDRVLDPKYYEPMQRGGAAYNRHMAKIKSDPAYAAQLRKEIDEVLGGSNHSNYATDNASAQVKKNAIARGDTLAKTADNGEGFFRKDVNPDYHGAGVVRDTKKWYEETKRADEIEARSRSNAGLVDPNEKNALDEAADVPKREVLPKGDRLPGRALVEGGDGTDDGGNDTVGGGKLKRIQIDTPAEVTGGPRADSGEFNTAEVLSTQGPSHFDDFPGVGGSNAGQGTGA